MKTMKMYIREIQLIQENFLRISWFEKRVNNDENNFDYIQDEKKNIKLLTMNEIFNGKKEYNYPWNIKCYKRWNN